MTGTPGDPDPFVRYGFTSDQAAGFRAAWKSPNLVHFLDPVANVIHDQGGTPEDCLDYIKHALEEAEASLFHSHGFTGHQAAAIAHDPKALSNLYDRPAADIPDLLADDGTPRAFITDALRVARTPDEAERLLARYRQTVAGHPSITHGVEDTTDGLLAEAVVLAMGLSAPSCDCP